VLPQLLADTRTLLAKIWEEIAPAPPARRAARKPAATAKAPAKAARKRAPRSPVQQ
jgi:hypothetical protein